VEGSADRRKVTRRTIYIHLTAAVVVPGCLVLCWWQVTRALSGNTLSWAYVFEWPIFAGYGVFLWWKLIHDPERHPATEPAPSQVDAGAEPPGPTSQDADEDEEMASYNRYLAALNASGKRKHW
jgi:DNA-binding transcriptional regulator of glucitol operon